MAARLETVVWVEGASMHVFCGSIHQSTGFFIANKAYSTGHIGEVIQITGRSVMVVLPGKGGDEWETMEAGDSFFVPAHSEFKVDIGDAEFVEYRCLYTDDGNARF